MKISDLSPLHLSVNSLWPKSVPSTSLPSLIAHATLDLLLTPQYLTINLRGVFRGDPPPPGPPGPLWELWKWEVIECFIVGEDQRYLELEFSPHGHMLGLQLHRPRCIQRDLIPFEFEVHSLDLSTSSWTGVAKIDTDLLPPPQRLDNDEIDYQVNAFACWGLAPHRQHAVAFSVGEGSPDFHRLDQFPSWRTLSLGREGNRI